MNARRNQGFTLVELLVVIAIIGILIALLLPAVQAVREAARRLQCQNNLKQLGLAVQNYHDTHKKFPPSSMWYPASTSAEKANIDSRNNPNLRANWVILVLPYMEQKPLFDRFDLTQPITAAINAEPRSEKISTMLCPSDQYNEEPFNGSASSQTNQMGDNWARGNYAANAALGYMTYKLHGGIRSAAFPDSGGWRDNRTKGVMGANASLKIEDIKDGSTHTVLVAEIRAGITAFDSRGVWAMSGGCPSALWAHGYIGDDYGPNNNTSLLADDVLACTEIQAQYGGAAAVAEMGMSCSNGNWPNFQQTARSTHAGGVNVCMADGSVHFLGDFIEVSVNNINYASTWDRLMLSNDGYSVEAGSF